MERDHGKLPMTIMLPLPERLEWDVQDLTSDSLLGERLSESATSACKERSSPSFAGQPLQPQSLTVTPERATNQNVLGSALTDSSNELSSEAKIQATGPCGKRDERIMEDKGLRSKFLRFLEKEARKKRRSLTELRRRSAIELDDGTRTKLLAVSDKISSELEAMEELFLENQEALVNEHLEMVLDTRISSFASSFSSASDESKSPAEVHAVTPPAPTHWRSRIRRATPHVRRKEIRASPVCKAATPKFLSTEAMNSKDGSLQKSAPERYCEKVEARVKPLLRPVDCVLSKISSFVHGPTSRERQPQVKSPVGTSLLLRQKESSAEPYAAVRKDLAREFWGSIACGACVDGSVSEGKRELPSGCHAEMKGVLHSAHIKTMLRIEESIDAEVQANLDKIRSQIGTSQNGVAGSPKDERALQRGIPFFASEIQVPVSSLQIDRAISAVLPNRKHEIAESVVELAQDGRSPQALARGREAGVEETRRKLFESLGETDPTCSRSSQLACPGLPSPPGSRSTSWHGTTTSMPTSAIPTSEATSGAVFFLADAKDADFPSTPQPPPRIWGVPLADEDADVEGVTVSQAGGELADLSSSRTSGRATLPLQFSSFVQGSSQTEPSCMERLDCLPGRAAPPQLWSCEGAPWP